MNSLLEQAYDSDQFRKQAHELVDVLADYLDAAVNKKEQPVFTSFDPDELYTEWKKGLANPSPKNFAGWSRRVIEDSIHLHNPGYMGHQVSPVLPQAALADFMSAVLNNGVGVYEMGSPTVAMERVVIKHLAEQIGFDDGADGVLTSGGTLGNLTALLTARQVKADGNVWSEGNQNRQYGIMVSEEAHYSIERAVKILGWGEEGIIKVPVDNQFRLDPSALDRRLEEAQAKGVEVIGVVASACSTATGSFDPITEIADFCKRHDLWFHVDAAHGGGALYSDEYRSLLKGIDEADSVIVDFHKMMMCPALVTGVVFKNGQHSYQTFAQKAEYLWKHEGREWFNLGKRTFECTKDMMALEVYSILHSYGTELFKENIERLFRLATDFAGMIEDHPDFELLTNPESNIVCFRYNAPGVKDINELNEKIRQSLIKESQYFIVQTNINRETYLRTTLMNPFTSIAHLKDLLDEIEKLAKKLE